MTKISDVTAFVFQNPDYWLELLAGADYPDGLSADETAALEGARDHVERQVTEMLHVCGAKLPVANASVYARKFKGASTAKNRSVTLYPVPSIAGKLYRVEFGLDTAGDGASVQLYASIVVKKGYLDTLRTNLSTAGTAHSVDNYYVYAPGVSLTANAGLEGIADQAVSAMCKLLDAVK